MGPYQVLPLWTREQWQWRDTLHFPMLQNYWSLAIRLFSVISRTLAGEESYPSAEMQSVYSIAPAKKAAIFFSPCLHQLLVNSRADLILLSLSSITTGRSSRLHLVSIQGWCKSLLSGQHWHVHKKMSGVHSYFFRSAPHVLFVLHRRFVWWEAGVHSATLLLSIVSRICSRQYSTFFCGFYLVFSLSILFVSMWCIYTIVWTQPQLGRHHIAVTDSLERPYARSICSIFPLCMEVNVSEKSMKLFFISSWTLWNQNGHF